MTAALTDGSIKPCQAIPLARGSFTHLAGITASGSAQLTLTPGTGTPPVFNACDGSQSVPVIGNVADGATETGAAVKTGGLAKTAEPTAVADGQRVSDLHDPYGRQVVVPALRGSKNKQHTTITASASETPIVTAGASGVFNDIWRIVINNSSATDGACTVKEATAGATIWVFSVKAGTHGGFAGGAGDATRQTTAANNWAATCTSLSSWDITVDYVATKG